MFSDTPEFKDLDPDLNDINELRKLKKGSHKRVHWICYKSNCGPHRWIARIQDRTGK